MKKYTFILMLFSSLTCFSQYCYVADTTLGSLKSATMNYEPGSPIKYLRVILHFIQKDNGTGNFNENNDGMTPSHNFNGYEFAEYIINYANNLLENNQPMRIQPFGEIPVYDPGYRYKLSGVFFWKNSTLYYSYYALSALFSNYGQASNSAINVFITSPQGSTTGYAEYVGDKKILLFTPYLNYTNSINYNDSWFNRASATLLNHEIGHCLGLYHTILTNGGDCCISCNDYCDDTPSIPQMLSLGEPSPCCWNGDTCSNNLMDSNADMQTITPDQLNRVHYELDNAKLSFIKCNFQTSVLNISTFNNNSGAYIANSISVSGSSSLIPNGKTVYLEGNNISLNSGFEVQAGGKLIISVNPECN